MRVRRDHVAGGAFLVIGVLVLALSTDLPFGTLASPGAGMLPILLAGLMIVFGLVLALRAQMSPQLGEIDWSDLPHAARAGLLAATAAILYLPLGFAITSALLLLALIALIERRPLLPAAAFGLAATAVIYALFAVLLRTPLPRGPLGF